MEMDRRSTRCFIFFAGPSASCQPWQKYPCREVCRAVELVEVVIAALFNMLWTDLESSFGCINIVPLCPTGTLFLGSLDGDVRTSKVPVSRAAYSKVSKTAAALSAGSLHQVCFVTRRLS